MDQVTKADLGVGYGQNALSQSIMNNVFNNGNGVSKADKLDYLYFSHYRGFKADIP